MFKVHYIVSAAALEKLLKATDDLAIKHSNIEHLRLEDIPVPTIYEHLEIPSPPKGRMRIPGLADGVKNKRATDDDIILLTDERPRKGSIRDKIVIALEKLEVKHGVGEVTRSMLRTRCKKLGLDPQILNQLLVMGYAISK